MTVFSQTEFAVLILLTVLLRNEEHQLKYFGIKKTERPKPLFTVSANNSTLNFTDK